VDVTVDAVSRHGRIEQDLTDGRALRIETVIRDHGVDATSVGVQP
jgi:hypothetical protein